MKILKSALAGFCKTFERFLGWAKRSSICKNREKNIMRLARSRFHTCRWRIPEVLEQGK